MCNTEWQVLKKFISDQHGRYFTSRLEVYDLCNGKSMYGSECDLLLGILKKMEKLESMGLREYLPELQKLINEKELL